MGSLFSTPKVRTPAPAVIEPVAPLPVAAPIEVADTKAPEAKAVAIADPAAAVKAKTRLAAEAQRRGGRASTVLSADTLGA